MKYIHSSFKWICALLLLTLPAGAQTAVTALHGSIVDQSGAALPNAHISITDPDSGFRAERLSSAHGEYAFDQLTPGRYSILVSAPGFSSEKQLAELLVNQTRVVEFKMNVAAANVETIEVDDSAASLNTSDATIGTPFDTTADPGSPVRGQ